MENFIKEIVDPIGTICLVLLSKIYMGEKKEKAFVDKIVSACLTLIIGLNILNIGITMVSHYL